MPKHRSLTLIVAAGLVAAGCDAAAGNKPAARTPLTAAAVRGQSRVDGYLADAEVAAAAGDLLSARRYLAEALDSEPTNATARARLIALGGVPQPLPATAGSTLVAGASTPSVAPVPVPTTVTTPVAVTGPTRAAPAAVPAAVSQPVRPMVASVAAPRRHAPATTAMRSTYVSRGDVARATPPADVASVTSTQAPVSALRSTERETLADANQPAPASTVRNVANPPAPLVHAANHKRTWPWTRAQRWLVAKGIGAGGGAGVVIGAIVGNVPGALIAGSLTGGALGFHKATKIGPAAPYPSKADSVAFDAQHGRTRTDSLSAGQTRVGQVRPHSDAGNTVASRP